MGGEQYGLIFFFTKNRYTPTSNCLTPQQSPTLATTQNKLQSNTMTTFWPGPLSKHPEHPSKAIATTENTLETAMQYHGNCYFDMGQ